MYKVGGKFLQFCDEFNYKIKNVCTYGDWKGKSTFVGDVGNSVLDLIIEVEKSEVGIVNELKVIPRADSDNLLVAFYLLTERRNCSSSLVQGEQEGEDMKIGWNNRMEDRYRDIMEKKWEQAEVEGKNAQEKWDLLIGK